MNRRLGEWDRFTALGVPRLKRINDKVIEEILAELLEKKRVVPPTIMTAE